MPIGSGRRWRQQLQSQWSSPGDDSPGPAVEPQIKIVEIIEGLDPMVVAFLERSSCFFTTSRKSSHPTWQTLMTPACAKQSLMEIGEEKLAGNFAPVRITLTNMNVLREIKNLTQPTDLNTLLASGSSQI
jgi:hypothetical protein